MRQDPVSPMHTDEHAETDKRTRRCPWLMRVAQLGFLFFLIKGLLWLVVPALALYFGFQG
jgi:hypothetical protein